MQMKLKSVKNATQMTLQSYVAKAYMLSYIQQKSVEFYYVLQATSKTAPTDLNRKNVFFQKWNGGFIQLGKMVSIDKISASNSKFENLRWTPYQYQETPRHLTRFQILQFSQQLLRVAGTSTSTSQGVMGSVSWGYTYVHTVRTLQLAASDETTETRHEPFR